MNVRDLHDDVDGDEPPSADLLAGEYVLGVLDAAARRQAQARIERDPGFARLVADWEARLAPWLADYPEQAVPAHVWPQLLRRLGWAPVQPVRAGAWNNIGLWRGLAGLAAAAAVAAVFVGRAPEPRPVPVPVPTPIVVAPPPEATLAKPVVTLAHDDGTPGWLASVDRERGTVLMVPVPAPADAAGRAPELWVIAPGEAPRSLGLVSIDKSHTVTVPEELREDLVKGALLAITLEPPTGAPGGIPSGPVVAKGEILQL